MSQQQQQNQLPDDEIVQGQEPTEEDQRLITLFDEMESKQLDFLDESGKSIIERIATFLAVLFGVTVLGNNFPPPYLKGNYTAKWLVIVTLVFYLLAMMAGVLAIQPRLYRRYTHNLSALSRELRKIRRYKMWWLRVAGVLFVLGSVALGVLIVSIVWMV
jgi:hypothetical protein